MYSKIAASITRKLSDWNVIENEKFEIYSYSFEILIAYFSYFTIFIIISILTKTYLESLFFIIGFCILRHFAGGYHTSTYLRCHLLFSFTHTILIIACKIIPTTWYLTSIIILLVCILFSVIICAPVDNINKPFSKLEFSRFRTKSRIYVCLMSIIFGIASWAFDIIRPLIFCFAVGSFFAATSLWVAKIMNSKRVCNQGV